MKINHNELLTYPNKFDQIMFGTRASRPATWAPPASAPPSTSAPSESTRQIVRRSAEAFAEAHELGMATVLWCYLRNNAFKKDGVDYHVAADLTGQANHLGVTIEADIIKQKLPENNGGYNAALELRQDSTSWSTTELTTDHPIDLCRYQVANCYMGRIGLINSGGESKGASDLAEAVRTAVINKRAGGMGLISGRKAFQRPMAEGVELLNAIQDVYLDASDHRRLTSRTDTLPVITSPTTWLLDLDGVVWLGEVAIDGAADAVATLRDAGHTVAFGTNNSSATRADYETKLAGIGIPAGGAAVLSSAMAAASMLRPGGNGSSCARGRRPRSRAGRRGGRGRRGRRSGRHRPGGVPHSRSTTTR